MGAFLWEKKYGSLISDANFFYIGYLNSYPKYARYENL